MPGKIFISYRRDDASAEARSIYLRLQAIFGSANLFMDVDTIEHGRDFREVLESHLPKSAVQLVLIGPGWLGNPEHGQDRRLDQDDDFVRIEVASALRSKIPVIPVLVGGAQMPQEKDLPDDIGALAFRQSARVTHENFAGDMELLERDLRKFVKPSRNWSKILPVAAGLLGAAVLGILVAIWSQQQIQPNEQSGSGAGKPKAAERAFTSFEVNTDRPGGDYTSHRLEQDDALACQKLCAEDQRCLAWTYVAPGYQEANAVCWLKNKVPAQTRSDVCCVSGVAYYRRPKP